jgi:predicted O-methyltransferase YrrM
MRPTISRLDELRSEGRVAPNDDVPEHNLVGGLIELLRYPQPIGRAIEIGCWWGTSSEVIAIHVKSLLCIDPWPSDDVYAAWERRMRRYPHVRYVRDSSPEALAVLPRESFDFAYLDGGHAYHQVVADILALQRVVRVGGVIAGHDYGGLCQDVQRAVDTMLGEPLKRYKDSSWLCLNK